jgi:manganese-dependent inorganic pyrophosphatase
MPDLYVIGHVNPDMDTISSAIGYAWLLREGEGVDAAAARAGALNPQTTWVLDFLKLEAPSLLTDASPRFESVTRRFDTLTPDQPLRNAWAIANRTGGVAPVVNKDGTPYGLVTGWSLFNFISEGVGPNLNRGEDQITKMLDSPCEAACETEVPKFNASARIRDSLKRILREESTDFWVVDGNGQYVGICRQRDLLNPPRLRLVLVDHNEARQAIGSLDEAELVEILDHHRLDNPATREPIRVTVDVVGSTSTLVSERIEEAGLSTPPEIAGVLLAGLMSDTLVLTSPTTTERDHKAAKRLSRWAFRAGGIMADETTESFGEKVISAGAGLKSRKPDEIITNDMKMYEAGEMHFSVSQAEVTKYLELEESSGDLYKALNEHKQRNGLDFAMLMVTNVVAGSSHILMSSEPPAILDELPYPPLPDGSRDAKGVVSRKKQLLPTVLSLLES